MSTGIAVIGAGIMGADHAQIIANDLPGATLQVVCDASEDRAREIAERCAAGSISTDAVATIARSDVDAVVIASPDDTHAELTLAAIAACKPVLCEKPLAPDSADCRKVIEAEVACGRLMVQVGFMRRFDPSYSAMKSALTTGSIGAALMMHNFHRNVEAPVWFTGDMAISNSAPHEFDIARFVLDQELQSIHAFQVAKRQGAPVMMVLRTQSGQLVNIEVNNNAAYGYDVRGELVGESGSVFLNTPVHAVYNLGLQSSEHYAADWRPRFAEAYRQQSKAWLRFVNSGALDASAASTWDGYCATAIGEAGVRSLHSGEASDIVIAEKPSLYERN